MISVTVCIVFGSVTLLAVGAFAIQCVLVRDLNHEVKRLDGLLSSLRGEYRKEMAHRIQLGQRNRNAANALRGDE